MWKKSNRLKKTKLKFETDQAIKEYAEDLHKLNNLEIIDYKIVNEKDFTVTFNKKFIDYYNIHHDRLKVSSIENMIGAIKQFPEEFEIGKRPTDDQFASMFYSTLILSYIQDTGQEINVNDMNSVGRLIITVEHLRDMMIDDETNSKELN